MEPSIECQVIRPNWSPDAGPIRTFEEVFFALNGPEGYALLLLTLLLAFRPNLYTGLLAAFGAGALLASLYVYYTLSDELWLGAQSGCVGNLAFTFVVFGLIFLLGACVACSQIYRIYHGRPTK